MKKELIALVIGAAAITPAVSMASDKITIYGRAHVSADLLDDGADYSEVNLSSNASRLGFKGEREISPTLKAFFQIEQQINFASGGSDSGSVNLATRNTFVGLAGEFGQLQIGRFDSPFKNARGPANLFGDQLGDLRNLARVGNGRFDERYDNTIQYTTPKFNGFTAAVAYSVHEGTWADEDRDESTVSMALNYAKGSFEGSLAFEKAEEDTGRGERDGVRAAVAYKLTDAFKLVGFFQSVEHDDPIEINRDLWTSDTVGLGGEYKLTPNTTIKTMLMSRDADADEADSSMFVLGLEHKLDSAVRVYANYAKVDNDDNINLVPWYASRSTNQLGSAGENASGFSIGLRYDF